MSRLGVQSIYRGPTIRFNLERVRLPNHHRIELEIVRHPGACAVVPLLDRDHVILIRQYRYAVDRYLYEIPAGKLKRGETPRQCASRELEEEIGYRAQSLRKLTTIFTAPGFCDERIHIFLATGLRQTEQNLEASEVLETVTLPWRRVEAMILKGTICDAKSLIGLEWVMHHPCTHGIPS